MLHMNDDMDLALPMENTLIHSSATSLVYLAMADAPHNVNFVVNVVAILLLSCITKMYGWSSTSTPHLFASRGSPATTDFHDQIRTFTTPQIPPPPPFPVTMAHIARD
jgi:hypothetical protein